METKKKTILGRELAKELIEGIEKTIQYPLLVSEDKEGFEKSIANFFRVMNPTIANVRKAFEEMNLSDQWSDEVWKNICIDRNFIRKLYEKKVEAIADSIGVSAGITSSGILNSKHPNISSIEFWMDNLLIGLDNTYRDSRSHLYPRDIVNIADTPKLSEKAYAEHLEAYRFYINSAKEHHIKTEIERFVASYNRFVDFLGNAGYGQHINSIYHTYLTEFFEEKENYHLVPHANAQTFLAKFKKD